MQRKLLVLDLRHHVMDNEACRTVGLIRGLVERRCKASDSPSHQVGTSIMTPINTLLLNDHVHQDMEAIFGRATDRSRFAFGDSAVLHRSRAGEVVPAHHYPGQPSKRVVAPVFLGCMLVAGFGGVLAFTGRNDMFAPRSVMAPSAEASRTTAALSTSNGRSIFATEISTPSRLDEGPHLARQETREGSAAATVRADEGALLPSADLTRSTPAAGQRPLSSARQRTVAPEHASERTFLEPSKPLPVSFAGRTGEATVRAFYHALGAGDGKAAAAQVIAEKRSSRAFSPGAISRFYGRLPEPLRLTGILPLARGAYRVSYRYSAGRSRCDGRAVVSLTYRGGRNFIRSIDALDKC